MNRQQAEIAEVIAAIEPGHSVWIAGREIARLDQAREMYTVDGKRYTFIEVYDLITLEPPPNAHLSAEDENETCLACGGELRFDGYDADGAEVWFCTECEREETRPVDFSALDQNAHYAAFEMDTQLEQEAWDG